MKEEGVIHSGPSQCIISIEQKTNSPSEGQKKAFWNATELMRHVVKRNIKHKLVGVSR